MADMRHRPNRGTIQVGHFLDSVISQNIQRAIYKRRYSLIKCNDGHIEKSYDTNREFRSSRPLPDKGDFLPEYFAAMF